MSKTISNKVLCVNSKDINTIKAKYSLNKATYIVEINGAHIQSWKDYISAIQDKFKFPTQCFDSIDRYLDWMRDLDWLHKEEYILIIDHYNLFMQNNPELRNQIISDLAEVILPFWQSEVERTVVGGKPKLFMVYLVN